MKPLPYGAGSRRPFNLWLQVQVAMKGSEIARERYGCSFSEMVERLVARESKTKTGLLSGRAGPRPRQPHSRRPLAVAK